MARSGQDLGAPRRHAELTHNLAYEKHHTSGRGSGNSRNGTSREKLKGDFGEAEMEVPQDRNGTFTPVIVALHRRRFTGFDDKFLSMYARGMRTREIRDIWKRSMGWRCRHH